MRAFLGPRRENGIGNNSSLRGAEGDAATMAGGMLADIIQPGAGTFLVAGSPVRTDNETPAPPKPAPALGEHTAEVLREMLGLGEGEIERLQEDGVI
jgi:2-methylfumaryl-CoA isomerase